MRTVSSVIAPLAVVFVLAALATPAFAAPGEVQNVQWCTGSKTCLQWDTVPSATSYRVYRGERVSFPCLLTPSVESCDEGSFATTTTSGTISDVPPAGSLFWFIVTASNGSGEGTAGSATPGARQQNVSSACLSSCALSGASCSVDADCCSTNCIGGTCQAACCQPTAGFCLANSDCCSGACSSGVCQGPCSSASECPGSDTFCQARSCTAGVCGFSNTAAGTPTNSQVPGDCQTAVCDGSGGVTNVQDNTDVPVDGNQCTSDVCSNGVPSNPAVPLGSPCNQNGGTVCSSFGTCVQCNAASDCPGADSECRQRSCQDATCGYSYTGAGIPTSSQTPGDCQTRVCDGTGNVVSQADNSDVPVDGNQCTSDVCMNGVPSNPSAPLNTPCNQNGGTVCNGFGSCVQCNSASQCPGVDTECKQRSCVSATCGFTFTSAGTVTGSQTPGDCHTNACDGAGNIVSNIDNTDVPVDGNQCTDDVCMGGTPSNPSSAAGTSCSQSGGTVCNGSGSCVIQPQVFSTFPADGVSSIASTSINVTFNVAMNPATLTAQTTEGSCSGSVQLSDDGFTTCASFSSAAPTMSGGNTLAALVPQPGLLVNRTYKIRVTTAAQGASGAPLASTYTNTTGFPTFGPNLCDGSVVISQIYGSGGLTGATYRNDFIELHNRGTTAVSLTGWSVQYASATGTTWLNQTNLTGSIAAGGYFLIQEASSGTNGSVLPTPDLTALPAIDMSGSNGKLALVSNTTQLSGACPTGGAIVDFVGYGSLATCNEGGNNAPSPSATTSIARFQSGCADINVNGSDFAAVAPTPRNSGTAASICSCVVRNESNAAAEADFCAVNFPSSLTVQTGTSTGSIYGQVYEAGVTEPAGPASAVRAQLGYGLPSANPEYQPGWTWTNAGYNTQVGNNDEYQTSFTAPAVGTYRYVYRFSVDSGVSWTYCDGTGADGGAGSTAGLTYDPLNVPVLTVTP